MTNDRRISLIKISHGLKEVLNNAGFTIESILNNEPSKIAEDLGNRCICRKDYSFRDKEGIRRHCSCEIIYFNDYRSETRKI